MYNFDKTKHNFTQYNIYGFPIEVYKGMGFENGKILEDESISKLLFLNL